MNNSANKVSFEQFVLDETGFDIDSRGITIGKQGNALQLRGPEAEIKELNGHIERNDKIMNYLSAREINDIRLLPSNTVETTQTLSDVLSKNLDLGSVKLTNTEQGIRIDFENPNDLQMVVNYMETHKDQLTMHSNFDNLLSHVKKIIKEKKPEYDRKIKEQQKIDKMSFKERLETTDFSPTKHGIEFNENGMSCSYSNSTSLQALIRHIEKNKDNPLLADLAAQNLANWKSNVFQLIEKEQIAQMSIKERLEESGFDPEENGIEFMDNNSFEPKDSSSLQKLIKHLKTHNKDPMLADLVGNLDNLKIKLVNLIEREQIAEKTVKERLEESDFYPEENGIYFKPDGRFIYNNSNSIKKLIEHIENNKRDPMIAGLVQNLSSLYDMYDVKKEKEVALEEQQKIDAMTVKERLEESGFYPEKNGTKFVFDEALDVVKENGSIISLDSQNVNENDVYAIPSTQKNQSGEVAI